MLDSHTLLWAIYEPHLLPGIVSSIIEEETNSLFLSHVSIWELTDKAAKFRLPTAGPSPDRIMLRILELRATVLAIDLDDIIASVKLPRHHGDPMDRLLIAQARRLEATLLSRDGKFKHYDVPTLWA